MGDFFRCMQFNYFNIHSHLNLKPLYEKRGEILERMREDGIGTIVVGVDFEISKIVLNNTTVSFVI